MTPAEPKTLTRASVGSPKLRHTVGAPNRRHALVCSTPLPRPNRSNILPSADSGFEFWVRYPLLRDANAPSPDNGNVVPASMRPTMIGLRKETAAPDRRHG